MTTSPRTYLKTELAPAERRAVLQLPEAYRFFFAAVEGLGVPRQSVEMLAVALRVEPADIMNTHASTLRRLRRLAAGIVPGRPRDAITSRIVAHAARLREAGTRWKAIASAVERHFGRRYKHRSIKEIVRRRKGQKGQRKSFVAIDENREMAGEFEFTLGGWQAKVHAEGEP